MVLRGSGDRVQMETWMETWTDADDRALRRHIRKISEAMYRQEHDVMDRVIRLRFADVHAHVAAHPEDIEEHGEAD